MVVTVTTAVVALLVGARKGDPLEDLPADIDAELVSTTLHLRLQEAATDATPPQIQVSLSLARRAETAEVLRKSDLLAIASACVSPGPPALEGVCWATTTLSDRVDGAPEAGQGISGSSRSRM